MKVCILVWNGGGCFWWNNRKFSSLGPCYRENSNTGVESWLLIKCGKQGNREQRGLDQFLESLITTKNVRDFKRRYLTLMEEFYFFLTGQFRNGFALTRHFSKESHHMRRDGLGSGSCTTTARSALHHQGRGREMTLMINKHI